MTEPSPGSAHAIIQSVEPLLSAVAARRGAKLALDLDASNDLEAPHAAEALQVVLLILAEHAEPDGELRVRARSREGGDAEVVVEGLALPDAFPDSASNGDLWRVAIPFLESHHRTRLAHDRDRVLLLVPHGDRAARRESQGRVTRVTSRTGTSPASR